MASFRKKPNGGLEPKDAPPVASTPVEAKLPPVADNPKPPEPIQVEPTPVEQAASSAIKQRLAEIERAEQLVQQSSSQQQPQHTEPQQPRGRAPMPSHVQEWINKNPQYFNDPVKAAELNLATTKCVRDGKTWHDADFIPTMERHLGIAPTTNGHALKPSGPVEINEPRPTPTPPRAASPVRQQAAPRQTVPMSAPPTREVPSMSTGRPIGRSGPLTAAELEVARAC